MAGEGEFPKSAGDVAYASEADSQVGNFQTVEAGENLTAGNVVYIHLTDGKVYKSDTGTADDIRATGIVIATVTSGNDATIQTGGKYVTTGLTDKQDYYLGAAGAISTTLSGVRIGTALSTTALWIHIVQDDRDTIGTVKAYLKSFTNIPSNNLTAFWVECSGQTLSDAESILDGQVIPDLAGNNSFLRGNSTSGGTGGTETHTHTTTVEMENSDQGSSGKDMLFRIGNLEQEDGTWVSDATSTLPTYYEVVWIMKIK